MNDRVKSEEVYVETDLSGNILAVDGSYRDLLGYDESDLLGQNVELLVPAELRGDHREHVSRFSHSLSERPMGVGMELQMLRANGERVPIVASLQIPDDGDRSKVVAVIRQRTSNDLEVDDGLDRLTSRLQRYELARRSLDDICSEITEFASDRFWGFPVGILRHDSDRSCYVIEAVNKLPEDLVGVELPISENGLLTRALTSRGVALDEFDTPTAKWPGFAVELGITGAVATTIGGTTDPYGVMVAMFMPERRPTIEDAYRLRAIATRVSRYIVSAQSVEDLTKESKLQADIAEIGRVFSDSNQNDERFKSFASLVGDLIPFDRLTLGEIDEEKRTTRVKFAIDSDGSGIERFRVGVLRSVVGTSTERMLKERTGVILNYDTPEEFSASLPGAPGPEFGLTSVMNIPLATGGEIFGTFTLNAQGGIPFSEGHLQLGERIAAQISGSFLSSLLSESLQREVARRNSLDELSQVIGSNLDIAEVFPRFAELLSGVIEHDYVVIVDVDVENGTKTNFLEHGKYKHGLNAEPIEGSLSGVVIDHGEVVAVSAKTVESDPNINPLVRTHSAFNFSRTGMKAWIAAPLFDEGQLFGVLHIQSEEDLEYDDDDREFVGQLASRLATAVVNSRLHQAERDNARRQEVLSQISREIGQLHSHDGAFEKFADLLSELVPNDRVSVVNLNRVDGTGSLLFAHNSARIVGEDKLRFNTVATPVFEAAVNGETLVLNNQEEALRFEKWSGGERGIRSAVSVPMGSDGDHRRVFHVASVDENVYDESAVAMIEQVANQIAGTIENQQLYRRSLELNAERERSIRLEAETARLSGINEAKNEFLNLLTHELKTPLTSIIAFANMLRRPSEVELSDRQSQQLDVIHRNAWQLDALIQDLVDVSSVERGTIELEPQVTDISSLVADVLEGLTPNLEARKQRAEFTASSGDSDAYVDRQRITQVVSNLVSNASKYSPTGTSIFVSVKVDDDCVVVTVDDEGPGIPEDDLGRVFDLFHRVDNEATRQVPGTGQGLYLVKQLVELHEGAVSLANRTGDDVGVRAVVSLPRAYGG